jgi:hypothetical protein
MTLYGSGVRNAELTHLKVTDSLDADFPSSCD